MNRATDTRLNATGTVRSDTEEAAIFHAHCRVERATNRYHLTRTRADAQEASAAYDALAMLDRDHTAHYAWMARNYARWAEHASN